MRGYPRESTVTDPLSNHVYKLLGRFALDAPPTPARGNQDLRVEGSVCDNARVDNGILISVLIPAYNEEQFIAGSLDSVRRSFSAIGQSSYEIVVCDNNSTDRTAEIARAAGARVVVEPHNQIARARNTAAKTARGQWFIFLDADTQLNSSVLRATITALESGQAGAGGALVRLDP